MTGFARVMELEAEDREEQRDAFVIGPLRASIKHMLHYPDQFSDWTVQGFGMMRCYIPGPVYDKQFRLNIWDSALAVPNVSTIHDHPWHFRSWIINGVFTNERFVADHYNGEPYEYRVIKTGVDAGLQETEHLRMNLRSCGYEEYTTGDTYEQIADEIHRSLPGDSTVTLNARTRVGDGEHARVFWPDGEDWVDAKPRKATRNEILRTTYLALENWR